MHESPKFLYNQKKYREARKVLEEIAQSNGIKMKEFRFMEEEDTPNMIKKISLDPVEEQSSLINNQGGNH